MKNVDQAGATLIQSANLQAADARYYVDNFEQPASKFDIERLEGEADACAVRQCVARRAGRAIRTQRRESRALAAA
jgi:hypothetical protein